MTRQKLVFGLGGLFLICMIILVVIVMRRPPEPGTAASFRAMSAASGVVVPHSVPMQARRDNADSCLGYNLELEEGAGIQIRIGNQAEAQRLMSLRQNCGSGSSTVIRSAR